MPLIVVMDGMSEFDWRIISQSFKGMKYEQSAVFAMVPTSTSVSRQCLLSNKYPSQLMEPWKQSKEKTEFVEFPKYYLSKEYDYLICDIGESLDAKGEDVMTHGGLSIDEVVVPFITIKAVENNG